VAGFSISIEAIPSADARRVIRQIRNLGADMTPLLLIVGGVIKDSIAKRFIDERGPGGVPWPKSKRALGLVKGRNGRKQPGKTLQDTGDLRDSIRSEVRGQLVEIGADGLDVPIKAAANQFGTTGSYSNSLVKRHSRVINSRFGVPLPAGPTRESVRAHIRSIPPRPFLGVDAADREALDEQFRAYLIGQLK
jgi:phage gpG-like protein